jgi:hypothetical protein
MSPSAGDLHAIARRAIRLGAAMADVVDEQRQGDGVGLAAASLGLAKLAAVTAATPAVAAATAALAAANTTRSRAEADRLAVAVKAAAAGSSVEPFETVDHLEPEHGAVITSDLHRCIAGRRDWPGRQGTREIYEVMLDHYGAEQYVLIENGDVEDFWMGGGSTWGALYDLWRIGAGVVPGPVGAGVRGEIHRAHLERIVAANRSIYEQISSDFHAQGRYRRIVGNHDDVVREHEVAEALDAVHPGIELLDAVVLRPAVRTAPATVVTHGHQSDAWNGPGRAQLGRFFTWLGCGIDDAPVPWAMPGVPELAETRRLLEGDQPNVLTELPGPFGADSSLYSLDEVELLAAFDDRWGSAKSTDRPWLVLGHTHLALRSPVTPGRAGVFENYLNIGSGVGTSMVGAVEWTPGSDGGSPTLELVAWYVRRPDLPVAGEVLGRTTAGAPVARVVLAPAGDGGVLVPRDER